MGTKKLTNDLLKSKMIDAMVYRGYLRGSFNNALLPGIYWITASYATDFPSGAYKYGVLKVWYAGQFIEQEYTTHATGSSIYPSIYKRIYHQEAFTYWVRISGTVLD